jgi:UDP-N-acetyl-D-mannosaminuronic acid dehydrogenase
LEVTNDITKVSHADVFIITVGTPLSETFKPDLEQIRAAAESIKPYIKNNSLVMLKSTVPPGTTLNVVRPILLSAANIRLAFCPERLAEGKAIAEFLSIPVVVGGINDESTQAAAEFWRTSLGVSVITVGNAQCAEMVKLADNLWIDVNIALAGELAKLSEKMEIDVLEVIKEANTLPKGDYNVNILLPSVGVGGYCLTKDPWFVQKLGEKMGLDIKIPKTARNVNDSMPKYSAEISDKYLTKNDTNRNKKKIAILGIAFKNNTGDCRFTPTKPVIDSLLSLGYNLDIYDPWVIEYDAKSVTEQPLSHDIDKTLLGADCIAFLAGHREFYQLTIDKIRKLVKPGALIFDGRMFFNKEQIKEFTDSNFVYKGVGR